MKYYLQFLGILGLVLLSKTGEATSPLFQEWGLEYSFLLENKTNHVVSNLEFVCLAPANHPEGQKCKQLKSSRDFKYLSDEWGNSYLSFSIPQMSPFSSKIISVHCCVEVPQLRSSLPTSPLPVFLEPSELFPSEDPELKSLSGLFGGEKTGGSAKTIYEWVAQNIKYRGYKPQPSRISEILGDLSGDCTEYMTLEVALFRACGIKGRGVCGVYMNQPGRISATDFHDWGEYFDGKSWQIADAQKKNHEQNTEHYILFKIYEVSPQSPLRIWEKYKINSGDISVKMQTSYGGG